MTPAQTLLHCADLRVAADSLLERGDVHGEIFAVLASQGFALDMKWTLSPADDDSLERMRLIQASNLGMLRSKSRRWHKRRPEHTTFCSGNQRYDREHSRPPQCICGANRDVPLYKLYRQIGDPTESPGRWVFDEIVSVEEPSGYIELRARDLDDPFEKMIVEAHMRAGLERSPMTDHFAALAARCEYAGRPATARFVAYRLLQYVVADPTRIEQALHEAEAEARRWYGQRWVDSNLVPPISR